MNMGKINKRKTQTHTEPNIFMNDRTLLVIDPSHIIKIF